MKRVQLKQLYGCFNMVNENYVALKGDIPALLRSKFKSLCAMNNRTMSDVLLELVSGWVQNQENPLEKETSGDSDALGFLKTLLAGQSPDLTSINKLAHRRGLDPDNLVRLSELAQTIQKWKS